MIEDRRETFAAALSGLSPDALYDAFANEAIESGGSFIVPRPGDTWSGGLVEIFMHGITGRGADTASAMQDWRDAARRMCEVAA
jgi:hypothetical protein